MKLLWLILIVSIAMVMLCVDILFQIALWGVALAICYIVIRLIVNIVNKDDLLEGIGWRK